MTDLAYIGASEDLATETEAGTTTTHAYSPGGLLASKVGSGTAQLAIRDVHGDVVAQIAQGSATGLSSQLSPMDAGEFTFLFEHGYCEKGTRLKRIATYSGRPSNNYACVEKNR